jgi:hypothetical protein
VSNDVGRNQTSRPGKCWVLLGGATFLLIVFGLSMFAKGRPLFFQNPSLRVAETAISIWEHQTIEQPSYYKLYDELKALSKSDNKAYVQDVFSVGGDGRLVPKHCLMLAFIAAPMYGMFGWFGFWLLNQLIILAIVHSLFRLTSRFSSRDTGLYTLVAVFVGTSTIYSSYSMSYDLLAAMLIVVGFERSFERPFLGNLLLALSLMVRPTNAIFLPLMIVPWLMKTSISRRNMTLAFGGLAAGVGVLLITNAWIWGHPLACSYLRLPQFVAGEVTIGREAHYVDGFILFHDLWAKLLGQPNGLFRYNMFLLFLPLAFLYLRKHVGQRFFFCVGGVALLNCLVIFSYPYWEASSIGNRFLLPSIYLFLVPVVVFLSERFPVSIGAGTSEPAAELAQIPQCG